VAALYLGVRAPILITDPASAETCKYAANAFLATKISFANAVAAVCEAAGADVADVLMGIGYDSRIGHHFLKPGPGWGGSCFPKDTKAMIGIAADAGYDFAFLKGVIEVNDEQFDRVVDKIRVAAGGELAGVKVGVLGLTFKAGTDDMRDSPSIEITERLVAAGAVVSAYDPVATECPIDAVTVAEDPYAAADGVEVLAILTEWEEFKFLDLDRLAESMAGNAIVDGRNLLDRGAVRHRGFTYQGIGRS
jgi:UDPglucose 6-dehydrogenase